MTEKTSGDMFSLIQTRGAMGAVLEVLRASSIPRTKANYERIKAKLLSFPTDMVDVRIFQEHLQEVLEEEEAIIVLFKKNKGTKNEKTEKIGYKKEFQKGLSYYIGTNHAALSKIYVHWNEDKKFLFDNIDCLKKQGFWVKQNGNDCIPNVFCLTIFLYNPEDKKIMEGEISIYIGYASSKN
ncbi:MAG: hypothetical protein ACD_80C00048G0007 [uncultured bacterium (gcode 4)]|uniref:Uncharacterized protein n=1 Tax=uncultured bacterium (gcode 4) TaxID=1234023 RepID=K1XJT6_9BACT|nr:MAG: hypothetical protein ACD_80C00048G0007 [uncultured bacterium (gcode 4)]HBB04293.1 hypothetical protein [Candidatus Gracilibacteria bacterium]